MANQEIQVYHGTLPPAVHKSLTFYEVVRCEVKTPIPTGKYPERRQD